jgi:hypothetical protein
MVQAYHRVVATYLLVDGFWWQVEDEKTQTLFSGSPEYSACFDFVQFLKWCVDSLWQVVPRTGLCLATTAVMTRMSPPENVKNSQGHRILARVMRICLIKRTTYRFFFSLNLWCMVGRGLDEHGGLAERTRPKYCHRLTRQAISLIRLFWASG